VGLARVLTLSSAVVTPIRIALVGDYDPAVPAHLAIPRAIELCSAPLGRPIDARFIPTSEIDDTAASLREAHGIWCVPGSPYANATGALAAIRLARTQPIAFLGTCGGFQHAVMEIAQSVWGLPAPAHAELDPAAPDPIIVALRCALIDATAELRIRPGSHLFAAYGGATAREQYRCSYGIGLRCAGFLEAGPLRATAWDADGDVRAVELDGHPFFVGTLFQPERAAMAGQSPPIVAAFLRAAAATA
jgi:CTP synthase (UTP-ammonia lyase)